MISPIILLCTVHARNHFSVSSHLEWKSAHTSFCSAKVKHQNTHSSDLLFLLSATFSTFQQQKLYLLSWSHLEVLWWQVIQFHLLNKNYSSDQACISKLLPCSMRSIYSNTSSNVQQTAEQIQNLNQNNVKYCLSSFSQLKWYDIVTSYLWVMICADFVVAWLAPFLPLLFLQPLKSSCINVSLWV